MATNDDYKRGYEDALVSFYAGRTIDSILCHACDKSFDYERGVHAALETLKQEDCLRRMTPYKRSM